jgi:hypothetical protein
MPTEYLPILEGLVQGYVGPSIVESNPDITTVTTLDNGEPTTVKLEVKGVQGTLVLYHIETKLED